MCRSLDARHDPRAERVILAGRDTLNALINISVRITTVHRALAKPIAIGRLQTEKPINVPFNYPSPYGNGFVRFTFATLNVPPPSFSKTATNNFWGWHTSPTHRARSSVSGQSQFNGTDLLFSEWGSLSGQLDQAFEILTVTTMPPKMKTSCRRRSRRFTGSSPSRFYQKLGLGVCCRHQPRSVRKR